MKTTRLLAFTSALMMLIGSAAHAETVLKVFNSKEGADITSIFAGFEAQSGIHVEVISGSQANLLTKLQNGETADVMLVNDVINFSSLTKEGLFQAVNSPALDAAVPAQFRESLKRWYGLSYKARVIMYDPARVSPEELSSYEDLADPKWQGKLCLRNSQKTYNKALVASYVVHHGADGARELLRGMVSNLAAPVFDGDQKVLDAIQAGQCAIGVTNTYYLGRKLNADPSYRVRPFFPNQAGRGVHANIAGMAMLKVSQNQEAALKLMEYLASSDAMRAFADSNFEFPVNPSVRAGTVISGWESFKIDTTPVSIFGDIADFAAEVSLSAGYL